LSIEHALHSVPTRETRIQEALLADAVWRAMLFSFFLVLVFTAYGFTSHDFLIRFNPNIPLWQNLWQRVLFNSLPMFLIGAYLKWGKASYRVKLIAWMIGFSIVFHVGAWINVWQVLLKGNPIILTYVHAANVYLFAFCYVFVSPPGKYLWLFTGVLSCIFVGPLFAMAHFGGDITILKLTVNDTVFTIVSGLAGSQMIQTLRSRIAILEIEREEQAVKFLGPLVSKAIYKNQAELLTDWKGTAFVASLDIRNSTELQSKYGDQWLKFRKEYFREVSKIVSAHEGYIQKTVGDAHIIDFGILDYNPDLSDIPEIEKELATAEEKRLIRASEFAFSSLHQIFERFYEIALRHFPSEEMALGAGLDKGPVERHVQGHSEHHLELDVNGAPVNCSSRLQDYAKFLSMGKDKATSILVVSPFATDYLPADQLAEFTRRETSKAPIRNFPEIRWVLAREFRGEHFTRLHKKIA
jgi:class 3 adenylate cyclase